MISEAISRVLPTNESSLLDQEHADRAALFSVSYTPHQEEQAIPGAKTLATLKIFLAQARQAVSSDPHGAKQYVERALALLSHEGRRSATENPSALSIGGLASWQMLRVKSMIEARLGERLLIGELAAAVRLSPSHFARAFRRSAGCSPHHYMLQRRVERAKEQMRSSDAPLAQIALACGFSDQSHFTRCFKRCAGETPTAWHRRAARADVGDHAKPVALV